MQTHPIHLFCLFPSADNLKGRQLLHTTYKMFMTAAGVEGKHEPYWRSQHLTKMQHLMSSFQLEDMIFMLQIGTIKHHHTALFLLLLRLPFVICHLSPTFSYPIRLFFLLIISVSDVYVFDTSLFCLFPTHKTHTHILILSFMLVSSPCFFPLLAVLSLLFHCVYWGLYARDGVGSSSLKILGEFLQQPLTDVASAPEQNEWLGHDGDGCRCCWSSIISGFDGHAQHRAWILHVCACKVCCDLIFISPHW